MRELTDRAVELLACFVLKFRLLCSYIALRQVTYPLTRMSVQTDRAVELLAYSVLKFRLLCSYIALRQVTYPLTWLRVQTARLFCSKV